MYYYLSKFFQAVGLGMIAVGFAEKFPQLMNPRLFLLGMLVFGLGWCVETFFIKAKR